MHQDEKVKLRCVQCSKEFETTLEFYFNSWYVKPFCCDFCRNKFFESRNHPENCQCERCTKRDASD